MSNENGTDSERSGEDNECPCGQPAPRGEQICPECLTKLRARDRKADYDDYVEFLKNAETPW